MNTKKWFFAYLAETILILIVIAAAVIYIDPYFHYHYPHSDKYKYALAGERNINHGILEHFQYDALIIGTSMTQNFRTTEMDNLFGTRSVKVPFPGATFKEIDENIAHAIDKNPDLRIVVRALDYDMLFYGKDDMRTDLGRYPEYLYDENIFNDVEYIFNRSVVFEYVGKAVSNRIRGTAPGIDSFDDYSRWDIYYSFGPDCIYPSKNLVLSSVGSPVYLSPAEEQSVRENVQANVVSLAEANPEIDFYYFFTPYSAAWWQNKLESGQIQMVFRAEQIAVEEILKCENIKLFSLSDDADVCMDLNNYKDPTHYAPWINSLFLKLMRDERCILTEDNYLQRLDAQHSLYTEFDYNSLLTQEDYEDDLIAQKRLFSKYGF